MLGRGMVLLILLPVPASATRNKVKASLGGSPEEAGSATQHIFVKRIHAGHQQG